MLDVPLMLQVNLPVGDTIQPQSSKFVMGAKIKAVGNSKLKDSPDVLSSLTIHIDLDDLKLTSSFS